jgi:hypothetical protein
LFCYPSLHLNEASLFKVSSLSNLGLTSLKLLNKLLRRLLPVTLRVVLSPAPQILASILKSVLSTPAKLGVGTSGVGSKVEDIACTARGDFVGQVAADGGGEGLDHLVDGAALAGAQVPGADAGVVLTEVEDVDVVADGGAVFGVVVLGGKMLVCFSCRKP